jgi:hypothetical protein
MNITEQNVHLIRVGTILYRKADEAVFLVKKINKDRKTFRGVFRFENMEIDPVFKSFYVIYEYWYLKEDDEEEII